MTRGYGARLAAVAVAATLGVTGCSGGDEPPARPAPVAGGAAALPGPPPAGLALRPGPSGAPGAPAVTGALTDGSPVALADLWADRPVVLVFFTSWCTLCADRQAALSELARRHSDEVVLVGVATEDRPEDVQRYLREHRVDYPVVLDADGTIWRSYAVREPPAVVVVAKGGALLRGWPGGVDAATLDGELRRLVLAP
ncbi:redoxin domain-containing protein [Micromonospora terminaliae]|uniref:Redoxin domain-containing protein n=1 Tax=Micromonospora terminaliae TaxID=1914461 RepID=A0AAJ2ZD54_9ACTN|nr:TlpA disulfide reductase family protein [Micromonospora terminaliae]NES27471.1 TlpA family protein disulfide reductase [Micromonospora terminaliae]QGL47787.1 redoxin domain-containing protein [Micromonospora terminaliae]